MSKTFNLKFPSELLNEIRTIAETEDLSVAQYLRKISREDVAKRKASKHSEFPPKQQN